MPSLNRIQVMGHAGSDATSRSVGGKQVANFNVAISRRYRRGEAWENETIWLRVDAWDKLGEHVQRNVHKGDAVYVEGRLALRKYNDRNGVERVSAEIVADKVVKLGREKYEGDGDGNGRYRSNSMAPDPHTGVEDDIPF